MWKRNFFTEKKGNQTGLYYSNCGTWIKWLGKQEIKVFNNISKDTMYKFNIDNIKIGDKVVHEDETEGTVAYISSIHPCLIYFKMSNIYQAEWVYTKEELIRAVNNNELKQIGSYVNPHI